MKKIKLVLVLLIVIILLTGCNKIKVNEDKIEKTQKQTQKTEVTIPKYTDDNNTPISFYSSQGNKLIKTTEITKKLNVFDVIGSYQIYLSNEDEISLNKSFVESYYDKWQEYNPNNNIKVGFNIKFKTSNEDISYNILNPSNTFDRAEYIMTYLYDGYDNRNKGFYSHLEESDYTDTTLFTTLKIQCGEKFEEIISPIQVTIYSYDSQDDFENNEYRGNSKSTLTINIEK